jgi:hypothetical protein
MRDTANNDLEAVFKKDNQSIISSFNSSSPSSLPSTSSSSASTPAPSISSKMNTPLVLTKEAKKVLKEMLLNSKRNEFPKKSFTIGDKTKKYTAYLNFSTSVDQINDQKKSVDFQCLFCPVNTSCRLGETSNVLTHLKLHSKEIPDLDCWLKAWQASNKTAVNKTIIDKRVLNLVKFYIKSNSASSLFNEETFRNILEYSIPSAKSFTDVILPEVVFKTFSIAQKVVLIEFF